MINQYAAQTISTQSGTSPGLAGRPIGLKNFPKLSSNADHGTNAAKRTRLWRISMMASRRSRKRSGLERPRRTGFIEKHRKSGLQEPVAGIISQTFMQKNPCDSICWRILQGGLMSLDALQGDVPGAVEIGGRRCLPGAYAPGANRKTGQRRCSRIEIRNEERKLRRFRW